MRFGINSLWIVALLWAGCSSSSGSGSASCVEALEGCGSSSCEGNFVRRCSDDGTQYVYEACFPRTCSGGVCQTPACQNPGERRCVSDRPQAVKVCSANMAQWSEETCKAGTRCVAGACVPESCNKGSKACGWKTLLTCNPDGASWTEENCGTDEFCDATRTQCVSLDPLCASNPLGVACLSSEIELRCAPDSPMTEVGCPSHHHCLNGFCQPLVCGVQWDVISDVSEIAEDQWAVDTVEDLETADLDTFQWDLPPLQKPAKAWATFDGGPFFQERIEFNAAKTANYVMKDIDLQVSMGKGMYLLELHIVGVEEKRVGRFTSDEAESVQCMILFNDGTQDPLLVQWKYASIEYDITVQVFEDVGGRVIGTFQGTLEEQVEEGGTPTGLKVTVTDGYFDVPRKQ